jgi:CRISPR-associated protein Cas2
MALTVVIAYDISDDRRRARTAATLQTWGNRIQRSVFLCTLEQLDLDELHTRIGDIIDPDEDSLYTFRQCAPCRENVLVQGQAAVDPPALYWAVL